MKYSKKIQAVVDVKDWDSVHHAADDSLEETTEFELETVYANGYNLAKRAGNRPVFQVARDNDEGESFTLYFIGTEREVLARLGKLPDESG